MAFIVRRLLLCSFGSNCRFDNSIQTFRICGYSLEYLTAKLFRQCFHINLCLLLFIDVALIQGNDHRNAQFQQLCGEKQTAAEVRRINNVDDGVRMLVFDIGARDAFFRCKW